VSICPCQKTHHTHIVCLFLRLFMFPYDRRLLRCHPFWCQLRSPVATGDIHITSHKELYWMCCECDCVFNAAVCNRTRSSCRCDAHTRIVKGCNRPRYIGTIPIQVMQPIRGPIPLSVRRPIRAGLLLNVDHSQLCDVVASL
jgi:hypothetical protein